MRTVTVVRVDVTTGGGGGTAPVSLGLLGLLWMGGSTVVAPPLPGVLPVPTVRVTVSMTVSVITAQTVGTDWVEVVSGRPGVVAGDVPGGVVGVLGGPGGVVSGELGVGGVAVVGGTSVAVVLSLPEGVPGVPGVPGVTGVVSGLPGVVPVVSGLPGVVPGLPGVVPVVSGLPGVGVRVRVGGTPPVTVVVSLPEEGVSGPPGTLGVGVAGGTSTVIMVVVPLLP